jgi:hypothetical protein
MPRKTTGSASKASTTSKAPAKVPTRSTARPPAKPKAKFQFEVKLFTGNGEESIWFDQEKLLKRFIINVTKRNLSTAALEVTDSTGTLFVIRGFEFAKIIDHEA